MKRPLLSVIVPCYNEEKNIPLIVNGFEKAGKGKSFELVLVDNGSTDGSSKAMREAAKKRFVKTVEIKKNIGYGNGIRAGLREAIGEYVSWTHADMQTPPGDVFSALEIARSAEKPGNVFVKGRRTGRPMGDEFFTFGMSVFCSLALGKWLDDINAQPNLFHKSFLEKLGNAPNDFSFDLFALYKAKQQGMEIKRFGVQFLARKHGESSWNTGLQAKIRFIKRTIGFTLKLRKRIGA